MLLLRKLTLAPLMLSLFRIVCSSFIESHHRIAFWESSRTFSDRTRSRFPFRMDTTDMGGEGSTSHEGTAQNLDTAPSLPRKVHHVTVCVVPPPNATDVWDTVGSMRKQLRDPGYYRWPPHANLLYPFLEFQPKEDDNNETLKDIVEKLHSATRQCPPFQVQLSRLGTFGGKQRGVLWLAPDVSSTEKDLSEKSLETQENPILQMYSKLVEAFPECKDQTKGGSFTPHMTLSHFVNLDDALQAKEIIETDYADQLASMEFLLDRIYLLRRSGDNGQFLRIAEIGLGQESTATCLEPPEAFPGMPKEEDPWVHEE